MKAPRLAFLSAVALALVLPVSAQAQVVERATGSGHFLVGGQLRTFAFSAIKRANGRVTGNILIVARSVGIVAHHKVTCLNVVGNTAVMSGTVTRNTEAEFVGRTFRVTVQDNGEGANGPPDLVSGLSAPAAGFPHPAEEVCMADLPPQPLRPVERGNVQVSER